MRTKVVVAADSSLLITGLSELVVIPHYTMKKWNERMMDNLSFISEGELLTMLRGTRIFNRDVAIESLKKRELYDRFMDIDLPPQIRWDIVADFNVIGSKNRFLLSHEDEMSVFGCGVEEFTTQGGKDAIELTPNGEYYLHFRNRNGQVDTDNIEFPSCYFAEANITSKNGGKWAEVMISSSLVSSPMPPTTRG